MFSFSLPLADVKVTLAASQTPQIQSKPTSLALLAPSQTKEDPQPSAAPNGSAGPQIHQSLPDTQMNHAPVSQPQPSSHAPPEASYHHHHHHTAQCTAPSTATQQLHPSVVFSPHSASSTQLPPHSQIPVRHTDQPEVSLPPANPQARPHVAPQQPPVAPAHPPPPLAPYLQSFPGVVPLQQLSQLYQDPLYPGFPQGEKGSVAPIPPFSSCKSGEDLPQGRRE